MFEVKLSDKQSLRIKFRHDPPHRTFATIFDGQDPVATAVALCHSSDQFNRAKGRKISLARVLDESTLSRDERRRVWETYFAWSPKGAKA